MNSLAKGSTYMIGGGIDGRYRRQIDAFNNRLQPSNSIIQHMLLQLHKLHALY